MWLSVVIKKWTLCLCKLPGPQQVVMLMDGPTFTSRVCGVVWWCAKL